MCARTGIEGALRLKHVAVQSSFNAKPSVSFMPLSACIYTHMRHFSACMRLPSYFHCIKYKKKVKKCTTQCPTAQDDDYKLLVLCDQSSKTQRCSIYNHLNTLKKLDQHLIILILVLIDSTKARHAKTSLLLRTCDFCLQVLLHL